MNKHAMYKVMRHTVLITGLATGVALMPSAYAASTDWKPMSAEKLIKMHTNVMQRALEHDFSRSPLASELQSVDSRLGDTQSDLANLKGAIAKAEGEQKVELRHQLLEQKSAYIDTMQERQALKENELGTRLELYRGLLADMQQDARRANDPVSNEVRKAQASARERMQSVMGQVDKSLFEMSSYEQSKYAQEYEQNLSKLKQLQQAIASHAMQRALYDGEEQLTRESFVRQLMADVEADLALLQQEDEMLGYMARLVAMDAEAFQIELTYGAMPETQQAAHASKPANMVGFFVN